MKMKLLFTFLLTGSVYTGLTALFDLQDGSFSAWKSGLSFVLFGGLLTLVNYFSLRRNQRRESPK